MGLKIHSNRYFFLKESSATAYFRPLENKSRCPSGRAGPFFETSFAILILINTIFMALATRSHFLTTSLGPEASRMPQRPSKRPRNGSGVPIQRPFDRSRDRLPGYRDRAALAMGRGHLRGLRVVLRPRLLLRAPAKAGGPQKRLLQGLFATPNLPKYLKKGHEQPTKPCTKQFLYPHIGAM